MQELSTYDKYFSYPGKTNPKLGIFEHSNNVFQVAQYLIRKNISQVGDEKDLLLIGALVHDIGKIEHHITGNRWIHTRYSSKHLDDLLNDERFRLLLEDNKLDPNIDRAMLLKIGEEHHRCSPSLLAQCKGVILVSIADVIASCLEDGLVGKIEDLLSSNPYTQINLELTRSLGFTEGFSNEVHRVDLPGHSIEDVLLANMIFEQLATELSQTNVEILLQKLGTLWLVGNELEIRDILSNFKVDPITLYRSSFDDVVFANILDEIPPLLFQPSSLKFLFVNETVAIKEAIRIISSPKYRKIFECYDLSHLIDQAFHIFEDGLDKGVEALWEKVYERIFDIVNISDLPKKIVSEGIKEVKKIAGLAESISGLDKRTVQDVTELLKLFDCSDPAYRSLTNVIIEFRKMIIRIKKGCYSLRIADFALLDGMPMVQQSMPSNKKLCPVCRRFPHKLQAQALITGSPKTDSAFQIFRKSYANIQICRWCFLAGYMDIPISRIQIQGQRRVKQREHLLINSPMSRDRLQGLLDYVRSGAVGEIDDVNGKANQKSTDESSEFAELQELIGHDIGSDALGVYGLSDRRLSHLKGFAIPTQNYMSNLIGIRVPVESLVGEERVSGSVRNQLAKATMYSLYRFTGGSLHYGKPSEFQFSVFGEEVTLQELKRAWLAYRLADKYLRTVNRRTNRHMLEQAMFLELFNNPRYIIAFMFRKKRRDGFVLGQDKIKEVIELTEQIVIKEDWQFDLGLKIVGLLVEGGWCPRARSFWKNKNEQYSGVELVKWIRSIKMVRDPDSARAWGTRLLNGYRREKKRGPNQELVSAVLALVNDIVTTCNDKGCELGAFTRTIADMDLYLLFYYNHGIGGESE